MDKDKPKKPKFATSRKILLDKKLGELWITGITTFERHELLSCWERDRITNVIWRDILEQWNDSYEGDKPDKLSVIPCGENNAPHKYLMVMNELTRSLDEMSTMKTKK